MTAYPQKITFGGMQASGAHHVWEFALACLAARDIGG